jgi:hypothetical protein
MQIKLRAIVETRQQYQDLKNLKRQPPAPLNVRLARNLRQIGYELDTFDELNLALLKQYGQPNQRGGYGLDVEDTEAMSAYAEAYRSTVDTEVDVDIRPITISEIEAAQEKRPDFELPFDALVDMDFLFDLDN